MQELTILENESIGNMIYEIRGKQVMLDSDLAKLYQCINGTKTINQAVKRHIKRFPERFMFQLTEEEYICLRSQIGTTKSQAMSRTIPYVFTEQGVAMLATVLRTSVAEEVSIAIMDAFVQMRKYISNDLLKQRQYNDMLIRHDREIKVLQESFDKLQNNKTNNGLFFDGQIYDAYSLLLDIFSDANESIIILDNYIDKNILDVLRATNKNVQIITNQYNLQAFDKYKTQYQNIKLTINNKIHDRFIIIDNKTLYHSGASFKDLGKKCFAITKIENEEWLEKLLNLI